MQAKKRSIFTLKDGKVCRTDGRPLSDFVIEVDYEMINGKLVVIERRERPRPDLN